ncbi:hypothetical protein AVEN_71034-1, partial [Araneus ventricosus]
EDRFIVFSTTEITVKESSTAEEESAQKLPNDSCVIEKTVVWRTFKTFIFLICLIFLIIQSVEFCNIYYTYPTIIVQESTVIKDFKMPATTLCFRNTISTEKLCFEIPYLCEKPSNLEEFCKEYPFYCNGNTSMLMIPKMGYYTNYSEEVEEWSQFLLLNGSIDDPDLFSKDSSTQDVKTFLVDYDSSILKCYSNNLHLYQSGLKPQTKQIGHLPFNYGDHISGYIIQLHKIELFQPLDKPQVFFGIHSPFVPLDTITEGHEIRMGYDYHFQVQLASLRSLKNNVATASATKLNTLESSDGLEYDFQELKGNRIIDIQTFLGVFSILSCPKCFATGLKLTEDSKEGLCSNFAIVCKCGFMAGFTSTPKENKKCSLNTLLVFGLRLMGRGFSARMKLLCTLNLPYVCKKTFRTHELKLLEAVKYSCEENMKVASKEVQNLKKAQLVVFLLMACGIEEAISH